MPLLTKRNKILGFFGWLAIVFCAAAIGGGRISSCRLVLCTTYPPRLGSSGLGLRASVDSSICTHGSCGVVDLVRWRLSRSPVRAYFFPCAARIQRTMELVILRLAPRRAGLRGYSAAVGG